MISRRVHFKVKRMRKSFHVMIFSLVLAGCGADHPPETASVPVAKSAIDNAKWPSREARLPQVGIDSVLKAISGKVPISVRYDRVVQDKAGKKQRRAFVEMLGASAAQAETLATKAFTSSGFSVRRGKDDADGVRLQYRKKGVEPISLLIRDKKAGPPLKAVKATSSLYLRQKVL
jgi:hypothetical protein